MELNPTINYISADSLRQNFIDDTWRFCRSDWYIRKDTKDIAESVVEKKRALAQVDDETMTATLKVKSPLVVHQFTDEKGNLIHEIISGNTRTRSILETLGVTNPSVSFGSGKDGKTYNITEVEDIPFQVATNVSMKDALTEQAESNDYTRPHTPLDVALMVASVKPELEKQFIEQGKNSREAQRLATESLMALLKKEKPTILQGYSVITKGTEKLISFIREGYLSLDTASVIVSKANEKNSKILIDSAIETLLGRAKTEAQSSGSPIVITKKAFLNYVEDLRAASGDNADSDNDATPANSSSNSSSSRTPKPEISPDEFIQKSNVVFKTVSDIQPDELTPAQFSEINVLNKAMLAHIESVADLIPVGEQTLEIFRQLRQIYLATADSEALASAIKENEKVGFNQILSTISKASKSAKTLSAISNGEAVGETEEAPSDEATSVEPGDDALQSDAVVTAESDNVVEDETMIATLG